MQMLVSSRIKAPAPVVGMAPASEDLASILVECNPWLDGAADPMIQAFVAQIASEVGPVKQK
jgi:hypothetical protein